MDVIAHGTFGTVYRAQRAEETVAIKVVPLDRMRSIDHEIAIHAELAHTKSLLHDATRVVGAERRRVAELQEQTRADEEATRDAKVRTASLRTEVTQLRAADAILREEAKAARAQVRSSLLLFVLFHFFCSLIIDFFCLLRRTSSRRARARRSAAPTSCAARCARSS